MSDREIIESACECGEAVHVEVGGYSCRKDGKRPYHPGAADLTTQFRCRKCRKPLHETCVAAAFAGASPTASHDAGESVTADDASTPAWTSQSGRRIATLTAEVSRLTGELANRDAFVNTLSSRIGDRDAEATNQRYRTAAELERSRKECEGLREAALATAGMYGRDCRESMLRAFEQAVALSAGEKT